MAKEKVSVPAKNSIEREELKKVLREVNKWDEVSEVDTYVLEKVLNEERWDKKILNRIKKFLTIEVKKYFSLSKLADKEE